MPTLPVPLDSPTPLVYPPTLLPTATQTAYATPGVELTAEVTEEQPVPIEVNPIEDAAYAGAMQAGDTSYTVTFEGDPDFTAAYMPIAGGSSVDLVSQLGIPGNPGNSAHYQEVQPVNHWSTWERTVALSVPIVPGCTTITSVSFDYYFHRSRDSSVWAGIFVLTSYGPVNYDAPPASLASHQKAVGGNSFNQWLTFPLSPGPLQIAVTPSSSIYVHASMGTQDRYSLSYVYIDNITYTCAPPTPTPSPTNTPTPTPTFTPTPPWGETGIVLIRFDAPIPPLVEPYGGCSRDGSVQSRSPCGVEAYNQYRTQEGGLLTWGQLAALVAYGEGHNLLLGNEFGSFQNPQDSGLGVCWRRAAGDWLQGSDQCNVPSAPSAPGVQNDFVYAVWEWLFKECAMGTGFTPSDLPQYNVPPDYEKAGVRYNGECSEDGLASFLEQVASLYTESSHNMDPNLYLSRMEAEYDLWGWHDGIPNRYRYGICPCTWGNVGTEAEARTGNPGVNGGNAFSYFHWASQYSPNPQFRFFKVY
ncbi:MAG: hypothetical protein L6Q98_12250 [Anaerolineae bacterium]|nr:hypothetical protein [Anaerolineae bacterium]